MHAPWLENKAADQKLMKALARNVYGILADADAQDTEKRREFILSRLQEIDGPIPEAAE